MSAYVMVPYEVPPDAEHLATVGQALRISEADARRLGIRFNFVDVEAHGRREAHARAAAAGKRPGPMLRSCFDEESRVTVLEHALFAGSAITDTDTVLARQRYLEDGGELVVTEADGRTTFSASAEVDGYEVAVSLEVPAGTGGPDAHNRAALDKLTALVGRVWREHTR